MVAIKNISKLAIVSLAIACAASANAWITTIHGTNVGGQFTYMNSGEFSTLLPTPFNFAQFGITAGTGGFSSGMENYSFSFTQTGSTVFGGTVSMVGDWTLTSQSGFAPALAAMGTYSASVDNLYYAGGTGNFSWSWVGSVVPEPTPYAVLGVGMLGLLVRRKKNR